MRGPESARSDEWFGLRQSRDEPMFGGWCASGSPEVANTLATQGFDYVVVDVQHSLLGRDSFAACVAAVAGSGAAPAVRVPDNDETWIRWAVAAGARIVIIPQVESADEAARAAQSCRDALGHGHRQALGAADHVESDQPPSVLCVPMLESAAAIAQVDRIAAVEGVDCLYIGPRDLAVTFGLEPKLELKEARLADSARVVLDAAHTHGVAAGVQCESGEVARELVEAGFRMVTIGSDQQFIRASAAAMLRVARGAFPVVDRMAVAGSRRPTVLLSPASGAMRD